MTLPRPDKASSPGAISLIVPVYNVAPWLDECLDSIEAQELLPGEVILVDDGSTDGSGAICDRRAAARPALYRVIHKPNGGLSSARNSGLDIAGGSYVAFVDSDDTVGPAYLKRMAEAADLTGVDMVCAPLSDGGRSSAPAVYTSEEALRLVMLQRRAMQSSACAKLFAARLFAAERFREGILYEDLDIIGRLMLHARAVASVGRGDYRYRRRQGSITQHFNLRRLDVLDVAERNEALCASHFPRLVAASRERTFSAACNMLIELRRSGLGESADAHRCRRLIKERRLASLTGSGVRAKSRVAALLCVLGLERLALR